jgi:predicted Zn-ribbon and HTH transcriptional regulator
MSVFQPIRCQHCGFAFHAQVETKTQRVICPKCQKDARVYLVPPKETA